MDQGFLDLERLFRFHEAGNFFVTGETPDLKAQRRHLHRVAGFQKPLRRIRLKDPKTGQRLVFLTNNFVLPASTVTNLYGYDLCFRMAFRTEIFEGPNRRQIHDFIGGRYRD